MKISDLKDKNIAIWGLGVEGKAVLKKLNEEYPNKNITIINDSDAPQDKDKDGRNIYILKLLKDMDIVIRSPGVSIYKPEIIYAKKEYNTVFITEKTLFFSEIEDSNVKTIAITGTKGKTTTSTFCAYLLEKLGYKTLLVGNMGIPSLELVEQAKNSDFVVMETSSFQASDLLSFPKTAILLNLFHDHVAWHLTYENYYKDKTNLLSGAKYKIVNGGNERAMEYTQQFKDRILFNTDNTIHYNDGYFYDADKKLFSTKNMKLFGEHNYQNLCSVLTALKINGIDLNNLKQEFFDNFNPVEHRLEIIKKNNIIFVNDSISTIPEASISCFNAFKDKNIYAILGGYDKKNDMQELIDYISTRENIKFIALIGDVKDKLANLLKEKKYTNFTICNNMQESVDLLYNKAILDSNAVITMSPAHASYGLYKNFEERGRDFKNIVGKIS